MGIKRAKYLIPSESGEGYDQVNFETDATQVEETRNLKFVNEDDKNFLDNKREVLKKSDMTNDGNNSSTEKVVTGKALSDVKAQLGNVFIKVGGSKPTPEKDKTILWIEIEEE